MQPDPRNAERPNLRVTATVVSLAAMLWITIAAELLFVVPQFERTFMDFQMRLPLAAEAIISCSRWCVKYAYVLPLPMAMVVAGVAASTWLIRHWLRRSWFAGLWCLAMLLVPAAIAFLIWLVCYLPMERLLEGLAAPNG